MIGVEGARVFGSLQNGKLAVDALNLHVTVGDCGVRRL